jgi:hypothetical protein
MVVRSLGIGRGLSNRLCDRFGFFEGNLLVCALKQSLLQLLDGRQSLDLAMESTAK